jgi:hypothetical protein
MMYICLFPELKVSLHFRQRYDMKSEHVGHALIIDNEKFVNDVYSERTGTAVDSANLQTLFTQMGLKVH